MNIYDQHSKAFNQVASAALVKQGKQVGTIAFKYPKAGEGRLTCYLHIHGLSMVKGSASGYGYDKSSASFEQAIKALAIELEAYNSNEEYRNDSTAKLVKSIIKYGANCDGADWSDTIFKTRGLKVFSTL